MDLRLKKDHDCRKHLKEIKATSEAPYHFADSGLPNVYLTGIKYYICEVCKWIKAEIPAIGELMNALARALVEKQSPLSGTEIKFLRKRLGLKAIDFAGMVNVTAEQVSRWENDHNPPSGSTDRFIRIAYSFMSGDRKLKQLAQKMQNEFQKWSTSIQGGGRTERITAEHKRNNQWEAEASPMAA